MVRNMTIYENVSLWIDKKGFIKGPDGKLGQYVLNYDDSTDEKKEKSLKSFQFIADNNKAIVYVVREFVAVDVNGLSTKPYKFKDNNLQLS